MEKVNTWDLFHSMFKEGEQVVVIDEDDSFHWGYLFSSDVGGIHLTRPKRSEFIKWEDIVFISHDGFPVKKLPPSGADMFIEAMLKTKKIENKQQLIRETLTTDLCYYCGSLYFENSLNLIFRRHADNTKCPKCKYGYSDDDDDSPTYAPGHGPSTGLSFGDPFEIEKVSCRLFNPGNNSLYHEYYDDTFIETLAMVSKDGAKAQLFTLNTVF